jgi:hypothetical protein
MEFSQFHDMVVGQDSEMVMSRFELSNMVDRRFAVVNDEFERWNEGQRDKK